MALDGICLALIDERGIDRRTLVVAEHVKAEQKSSMAEKSNAEK